MKPNVSIVTSGNQGMENLLRGLKTIKESAVYVGIPEKNAGRKKGKGINNAQLLFLLTNGVRGVDMRRIMGAMQINRNINYKAALDLYLHTRGSAIWHIPPRPVIEPAIEATGNKERLETLLHQALAAALDGEEEKAKRFYKLAGMEAQNIVRAWFTDPRNNWAPNAPSTIRAKGSSRPNIEFGEMRKAITYVTQIGGKVE